MHRLLIILLLVGGLMAKKYTVVAGDNLFEIAKKYNVTTNAILDANPGVSGMGPGVVLTIPTGVKQVQAGAIDPYGGYTPSPGVPAPYVPPVVDPYGGYKPSPGVPKTYVPPPPPDPYGGYTPSPGVPKTYPGPPPPVPQPLTPTMPTMPPRAGATAQFQTPPLEPSRAGGIQPAVVPYQDIRARIAAATAAVPKATTIGAILGNLGTTQYTPRAQSPADYARRQVGLRTPISVLDQLSQWWTGKTTVGYQPERLETYGDVEAQRAQQRRAAELNTYYGIGETPVTDATQAALAQQGRGPSFRDYEALYQNRYGIPTTTGEEQGYVVDYYGKFRDEFGNMILDEEGLPFDKDTRRMVEVQKAGNKKTLLDLGVRPMYISEQERIDMGVTRDAMIDHGYVWDEENEQWIAADILADAPQIAGAALPGYGYSYNYPRRGYGGGEGGVGGLYGGYPVYGGGGGIEINFPEGTKSFVERGQRGISPKQLQNRAARFGAVSWRI